MGFFTDGVFAEKQKIDPMQDPVREEPIRFIRYQRRFQYPYPGTSLTLYWRKKSELKSSMKIVQPSPRVFNFVDISIIYLNNSPFVLHFPDRTRKRGEWA